MNRERKLTRARWAEAAFTVLAVLALVGLVLRPALLPLFLGVFTLGTLALMGWQYRLMDEFRRARYLMAWAATGATGFAAVTGLIVWAVFNPARPEGSPGAVPGLQFTLSLWALYVPWTVMLAAFLGVTAYLYHRDVVSARSEQSGAEA